MTLRGRLGALEERPFRLLWLAQSTSALGDAVVGVALTFAVLDVSDGTGLGLVLASYMGSRALFLLVGGVWADRLPRRLVMLAADLVRGGAQLLVAVALLTDSAELWHFVVAAFVTGIGAAFFNPASMGLVPATVSPPRLQQANALIDLSRSSIGIGGPALSGVLVASVGSGWVFAFDALTFAASAAFLAVLRVPAMAPRVKQTFLRDLGEGWREVRSRTWLVVGLVAPAFANIAIAFFFVLGPLVFEQELGGARDWGLAVTGGAVGGVLATVVGLRLSPRHPLRWTFAIWAVLPVALLSLIPPAPVLVVAAATGAGYFCVQLGNIWWNTIVQQQIPEHALSRVNSYDWMVSIVFMPIGYVIAGPLADAIGRDATLALGAVVAIAVNLAALGVRSVREMERLDHTEQRPAAAAAPAPD